MVKPKLESYRQIYLKTFFQNHITLKARLALLTLYNVRFSNWFEIGLLIWEYLQLISQIILFLPDLSEVYHPRLIIRIIVYSCKLINPSYLLSFDNSDTITSSIITLILIFTVLKYLTLLYVVGVSYWDTRESQTTFGIWRVIFKVQGRVFCYFTCSFWMRAILNIRDDGFQLYGMGQKSSIALLSVLWTIEYIFAFALETQFCDILPAKNLLSAKSYHLQMTTLGQKLVLQVLQMALRGNLKSRLWVSSIFALAFSLMRVQIFFATLPLYKLQALLLQVRLDSIVLGFSIAYFFQAIMMSAKYDDPNEEFIIVIGFILSLFMVKGSEGLLRELISRIFSSNIAENAPHLLMHKTILLKQLLKNERLNPECTAKYHWTFLACKTIDVHQDIMFNSAIDLDSSNLAEVKKMSLAYLENLGVKFQKYRLTQLYLSSMSLKNLKFSSKALKTIGSTIKKPWSKEYVSSLFLLCKFKEILTKDYKEKKDILDLSGFIRDQKVLSELKQKIIDQAEMQLSIGHNILREKCDFGEIFYKAQGIYKLRSLIHKEIRGLPSRVSEYSIEHLLLCAQYYLVLEFSQRNCQTFCENYHLKYIKHKKHLDSPDLLEENLYQSSNAFLIIAGQSKENGIVKYCSKSIESVLGGNIQGYHASHISSLFLPSMQNYYRNLFKKIFEKDNIHLLDRVHKVFLCHKKGYVTESQIYLQVHPYLTENIYVSMIIRNTSAFGDYLILKENGDIEGATKKISRQLGLDLVPSTTSVNVRTLSHDLGLANEAFNIVNTKTQSMNNSAMKVSQRISANFVVTETPGISSREANNTLNEDQASELYNLYSSNGKEIKVKPMNIKGQKDCEEEIYHCVIKVRTFEGSSLKIAKLTRAAKRPRKIIQQQEEIPLVSSQRFEFPLETVQETQDIGSPLSPWRAKTAMLTTDGNLLSPIGNDLLLSATSRINTDRKLLVEEQQEVHKGEEEDRASLEGGTEASKFQDVDRQRGENLADFLSVTTATFKSSQEKAIYRTYRNNITRKSYSKSFKFLCLTFYGVILMTLLSQVILKLVYDNTMNDLIIRKDLLNYAQTRSYYVSKLCYSMMAVYGLTIGINIWALPGSLTQPVSSIIGALPMFYDGLYEANTGIVNLLDQINDDNIRNELFKKDVQVNGSIYMLDDNTTHYENSFEVVELLISACQYLMNKNDQVGSSSRALMEYIRKNGENGFLVKNFEITEIFQASVNSQRQYLKNFILVCLILTPILLSGVAILLAAIIWRQYNEEVAYLQAFIKLDSSAIKSIMKDMEILKNAIINDTSFEDRRMIEFFWANSVIVKDAQIRTRHSRRDNQEHDYFKLQKRYFYYTVQVALFVGLLIGILLWNFISANHYTNIIYNHQSQLQLSNQLSERISIVVQGLAEVFQTNNTGQYVEMSPVDYVEGSLGELKTLQNTIITGFMEWDGTYDPQIKTFLFDGPPCSEYQNHFSPYCMYLTSQGVLTNVVSLTSYVLGLIENKLDQYYHMDRSVLLNIYAVLYKGANGFAVSTSLLAYQAQVMNSIIDVNLTKSISDANKNQAMILSIFVICLVLVSFLIWIQILKRIKEVRNDFKKVLQVLPPQLILSSFLLKQFLSKISNMAHDT